jgi:murein DD-endopeptidase MepM/ murein hydrolase activator NlpD
LSSGVIAPTLPADASSQSRAKANPSAPIRVKQGEVFYFSMPAGPDAESAQGQFRGRTIPFFRTEDGREFGALVGVDLADPPSKQDLLVEISGKGGVIKRRHYPVQVISVHFKTQELTVPQNFVDLDDETAKRVEEEKEKILQSLTKVTTERLWSGRFMMPVDGKIAGSFGRRRIINGQPRSPHNGEDINAPKGTAVHATNEGIIALVGDFFFSGKSIVVDHGLGLYTMYFHLDEVDVAEGEKIAKGAVLGKVGSTGRATGPHLHWGMRIDGARVNPLSILNVQ